MPTLPNRDVFRAIFNPVVRQLDQSRDRQMLETPFYQQVGDYAFENFYAALADYCQAQATAAPELNRVHQVSAPVGSGKTSFALAWVAAVTQHANSDPQSPRGCAIVVDQIGKAERMRKQLQALLPDTRVACWTHDHDPKCKHHRQIEVPAEGRFTQEDLANHQVIVVTHKFYYGARGKLARTLQHQGEARARAVVIVDEQPEDATIYDVTIAAATQVLVQVQEDAEHAETVGPHVQALVDHMRAHAYGGSIGKPAESSDQHASVQSLFWFTTDEAISYARAKGGDEDAPLRIVFEFARRYATGEGFIARTHGGKHGAHFIGYAQNVVCEPGTVLLDATADIDGVSHIAPWRHAPLLPPQVNYRNLNLVHVPSPTRQNLSAYLKEAHNRREYTAWMEDTIRQHMQPGQLGLVVCKKTLFDNESVPTWPQGDERHKNEKLYTERYGWELDGRKLCAVNWGTGIGDNAWHKAHVVFLFGEFYMPRRRYVAIAQALGGHKATQGPLSRMKALNSKDPEVDTLREGDLLRFNKQMALRGCGREYDENGVCGVQKVVFTGDAKRLMSNVDRLFPGAPVVDHTSAPSSRKLFKGDRFWEAIRTPGLPLVITTRDVSNLMGGEAAWRDFGKNLMRSPGWEEQLAREGWEYRPRCKGQPMGCFVRLVTGAHFAPSWIPLGASGKSAPEIAQAN